MWCLLELKYKGAPFIVAIEYEFSEGIYYGIAKHFSASVLNEEIKYFSAISKDREFQF